MADTIYYNSWFSFHKKPFGAVKKGTEVNFSIFVPEQTTEVSLVVKTSDPTLGKESYPMKKSRPSYYDVTYKVKVAPELYFYYFEITVEVEEGYHTYYYGAKEKSSGEGTTYSNEYEVRPYQLTSYVEEEKAPDWYLQSIFYQIFPDRFFNGNENGQVTAPKKNSFLYGQVTDDPMYIKNSQGEILRWDFYGGNLKGILKKLPYLKKLGVNGIYLNPIFLATSNHRYDTSDYLKIDPMLGTEEEFKNFVKILHKEGFHLILDGVFSHVGKDSLYFNENGDYGANVGAYQSKASPYYPWFTFTHYPNEYKTWWGIKDLPEVDKENKNYQEFIYGDENSVLEKWNALGVDGWRLDVADELPDSFIAGIRHNLDSYPDKVLIGEVWEDASNKISYGKRRCYILDHMLHGVMNYPFRQIILDLLNQEKKPAEIAAELMVIKENYPKNILLNNLNNIGTHDTERILTLLKENKKKVNLACGMMFMLPGIPCVYYGDEAGLKGGKDPENRKFFPWETPQPEIFQSYQKWINYRSNSAILKTGDFLPFYSHDLFGICRYTETGYTLYVFNPTNQVQKVSVEELNFNGESPLSYEKLAVIDGVKLQPLDGYLVSEKTYHKPHFS